MGRNGLIHELGDHLRHIVHQPPRPDLVMCITIAAYHASDLYGLLSCQIQSLFQSIYGLVCYLITRTCCIPLLDLFSIICFYVYHKAFVNVGIDYTHY